MSLQLYLVFVLATALLIATPGPNVALIVGTSLTHGPRTGLMAVAGVNIGVMIQLAVVAAGLAWIVEMFSRNFDLIRFVGAAYLLVLGVQTLWKARDRKSTRLNSSHVEISYAVFCLKKKKKKNNTIIYKKKKKKKKKKMKKIHSK